MRTVNFLLRLILFCVLLIALLNVFILIVDPSKSFYHVYLLMIIGLIALMVLYKKTSVFERKAAMYFCFGSALIFFIICQSTIAKGSLFSLLALVSFLLSGLEGLFSISIDYENI